MQTKSALAMDADMTTVQEPYDGSIDLREANTKHPLVHTLKQLQLDRNRIENEMQQKIKEAMDEYDAKRRAIVTGAHVPTEDECIYELADPIPEPQLSQPKEKGIRHFWSAILHNLRYFDRFMSHYDEPVLMHLVDVRSVNLDEPRGFKLEFEFSENEWFTNKVLTVAYYYREDTCGPLLPEDRTVNRMVGCTIDWKDGKDVTHTKEFMENQSKTFQELEGCVDSFFDFFSLPTVPLEHPTNSEEDRKSLMADFKVGELLRDRVIPCAIAYFTGECVEDGDDECEEDSAELEGDDNGEADEPSEPKWRGNPHFWLTALQNFKPIGKLISPDEQPVLMHLDEVRCVSLDQIKGFKLEFEFSENEWFTNKVLTIEYYYREDYSCSPLQFKDRTVILMKGCTIDWKQGKDVTHTQEMAENSFEDDSELEWVESFFDIFSPPNSSMDKRFFPDRRVAIDFIKVGKLLRDTVIPRTLSMFPDESEDDEDEDDENTDKEDSARSDENDEGESEDEDNSEPPTKKFKSAVSRGEGAKMAN